MFEINTECEDDWWEVEALYDSCFGGARLGLSSYRLRAGRAPVKEICLVMRDQNNSVAGAIRFWEVDVGGQACLLLGPIGVHPTRQGEGFGAILIREGLLKAEHHGWFHVLLIGGLPYYARFGFSRAGEGVYFPPPTNPERILGLSFDDTNLRFRLTGRVQRVVID